MSLDKSIEHGREHRVQYGTKNQPYCKSIDKQCRNHGTCEYCLRNRLHKHKKKDVATKDQLTEYAPVSQ